MADVTRVEVGCACNRCAGRVELVLQGDAVALEEWCSRLESCTGLRVEVALVQDDGAAYVAMGEPWPEVSARAYARVGLRKPTRRSHAMCQAQLRGISVTVRKHQPNWRERSKRA